jgi:proton-dependent oligopeptide transporter, POT family
MTDKIDDNKKMPKGIPYIIGNELAERFSYYGMKTILTVFMTKYLMDAAGNPAPMTHEESKVWYHLFLTANYFFPILGALLSDILWGKYRTIITLSLVYCAGHVALSMDETRLGLSLGLTMIALGSGGIKPCVSAHVGDQFGKQNFHLLEKVYNMFYLSINVGSMFSILLTPYLLRAYGPSLAFGVPGALMIMATLVFWVGRTKYTTVPPVGLKKYLTDFRTPEVQKALSGMAVIYLFFAIFWSLWEQTGSSWVLQADSEYMNKMVNLGFWKFELYPDQLQSLNAILVIIFVPTFTFGLYPLISRFFPLTPLRKISIGMFLTALSFVVIALAEVRIQHKIEVSILWQGVAYMILTAAEVMAYGTGLEFSYSQAPNSMKSLIMGMYMLSISLGNLITALINVFIQNPDGTSKLAGASYYWFFVWLMLATALGFIFIAKNYKVKTYVQEA